MHLVMRIDREDGPLVANLKSRGIEAKVVRGGVIVVLPQNGDRFEIPDEVCHGRLFIEATEGGGATSKRGQSTIICDIIGCALHPYFVPKHGDLSNGTHAFFSVSTDHVCVITGIRETEEVIIEVMHREQNEPLAVRLVRNELWRGRLVELPQMWSQFEEAALAAMAKANCYHCREAYYISIA
ncbi:MAG: hypothetical protein UT91_C0021G0006 [Parcubacteria group bacterium GW2011_GWA2_40_23]|nr:MAG: hypothetical protein UT91_C0021G0006 [Parcubacteria group bacterium GW2011_GWA2_40_23]